MWKLNLSSLNKGKKLQALLDEHDVKHAGLLPLSLQKELGFFRGQKWRYENGKGLTFSRLTVTNIYSNKSNLVTSILVTVGHEKWNGPM